MLVTLNNVLNEWHICPYHPYFAETDIDYEDSLYPKKGCFYKSVFWKQTNRTQGSYAEHRRVYWILFLRYDIKYD